MKVLDFVVEGKEMRCRIWDPVIPCDLGDGEVYKNGDLVVVVVAGDDEGGFEEVSKMC